MKLSSKTRVELKLGSKPIRITMFVLLYLVGVIDILTLVLLLIASGPYCLEELSCNKPLRIENNNN